MGRNARTRTPRGRRIALSCGTATGAALIAASISMGNAPAARAVVDADPLTDLIGAFDPNAFNSSDAPTDALGLVGYYTDTYLLGPTGLGAELDPIVDSWLTPTTAGAAATVLDADPLTDLIGAFDPNAFNSSDAPTDALGLVGYYIDTYLLGPTGLGAELDPIVDSWLTPTTAGAAATLDADPLTDLIGAFDPNAFNSSDAPTDALGLVGYYIDTYLLGPTGLGTELDPIVDSWLTPSTAGAAATLDADPLTDLIGAFDPNAFNSLDAPTDALGLVGYYIDTYLLGPTGLGTELDPIVDSWLTPTTTGAAATLDADPLTDLVAALDPSAFNVLGAPDDVLGLLASGLDADLLAPTDLGALLDPVIDGLLGSGLSLF